MIEQRTVHICDLCYKETHAGKLFRVQHTVDNSDLKNIHAAGIELYTVKETIPFSQASNTVVCFSCCEAIVDAMNMKRKDGA